MRELNMKMLRQRKIQKGNGIKNQILILISVAIFVTVCLYNTNIRGEELGGIKSKSSALDNITLIYNQVDADMFPVIVSLVTVMDEAGLIITKLDENHFKVYEDGVRELPIIVEELTASEIGINVILTIDKSESMEGQPVEDAKAAASIFVDLMQGKDRSAIVSFDHRIFTDHLFSNNKDSLRAAISSIRENGGGTSIYDALIHSADLMSSVLINRVIILLTDGEDRDSKQSYQQALDTLIPREIIVFPIGLGLKRNGPEENILIDLANKTGGMYYYSPTSSDLEEIYRAISMLLHHRYRITYTTHNPVKDGTLRHVRILVDVNNNTSSDTASYRAPFEPGVVDTLDPVDPESPFEVKPNPFTPNDDGFNDWAEFKKGDDLQLDWNIAIMDRAGRLIKNLTNGETIWDGKDKSGKVMLPGFYLYIVTNGNRLIHRGLVQLIR